jgi:hypothetical protein
VSFIHHQYWPLSPSCPANTPQSAARTVNWAIADGTMHAIRVMIPVGHKGTTGIRILYCGQQIMPWSNSFYLQGAGDTFDFAWGEEIMATNLQVQMYNTDRAAHNWWLYADIEPSLGTPPAAVAGTPGLSLPAPDTLAQISALAG